MSIRIAPSILAADFANLESEMAQVSTADLLHVDVMDGHFVPNLTIGIPVVKRLAEVSPLPLDVHLMIEDPDRWAPRYAELGAASVTFHFEAASDPRQCAADIKSTGARAAVAIKPGTPADAVMSLIEHVDMVLVMTVEPGFGGQSFMPETLPKLATLKAAAEQAGTALWLQVDGGITVETAPDAVAAGADTLVAGSSVFGPSDRAEAIQAIRNACQH
jgi:ribulose-phosphate 3-epimerase